VPAIPKGKLPHPAQQNWYPDTQKTPLKPQYVETNRVPGYAKTVAGSQNVSEKRKAVYYYRQLLREKRSNALTAPYRTHPGAEKIEAATVKATSPVRVVGRQTYTNCKLSPPWALSLTSFCGEGPCEWGTCF